MRWAAASTLALLAPFGRANDGAASTAAGGIQLTHEARISVEKERLSISATKVIVEYEFLNQSDRDIATEVAFPLPPYFAGFSDAPQPIANFHVWVEGREMKYQTQVKALVKDVDYSAQLARSGVDIASLGHFSYDLPVPDFARLSQAQQDELTRLGLFDDLFPVWTVAITHHWQQTFPARKILHVRHEYGPATGQMLTDKADLGPKPPDHHNANFAQWRIDPPLRRTLTAATQKEGYSSVRWVDYILTTANTWKTPIKDFELVVERPKLDLDGYGVLRYYYVSFCWDGPVLHPDPDHFAARVKNFVPRKELSIGFFPGDPPFRPGR